MADIINFHDLWQSKNGPDAEFKFQDDKGLLWYTYVASFEFGPDTFTFTFWATDIDDAAEKLKALRANAKLDGQVARIVSV